MEAREYRRLAAVEDSHWWYRAMHELVIEEIEDLYKGSALLTRQSLARILDAGCGTGGLTKKLGAFGSVVGLDISALALELANKKRLSLIEGSVNNLPLRRRCFDLIISISVLYHKRVDDTAATREFCRVLKQKGKVLLVLPAFSWMRGAHDKAVSTGKRYTLSEAKQMLAKSGFKTVEGRYLFSFLFPVFIIKRVIEKLFPSLGEVSDLSVPPKLINDFLFWLCRVEWKLGDFLKLPFGSSLLVVGEKQ